MSRSVEQIKERLPIVDIISSYIKLDRAGANFKGKCPFHNEKTPSFFVSPERNSYYCFGCGVKGDIFTFVQEFEKMDFKQALALLADRAGVVLETYAGPDQKEEKDEKEKLQSIMEVAADHFKEELWKDEKALKYLRDRGLTDETIKTWKLGSTKREWNDLENHLKALAIAESDIEKAGLIKKGNSGYYDRFRSRIMFPIFDPAGKVIAFTGRIKEWEKEEVKEGKEAIVEAKYLNSPDTALFDKSKTLYGYNKAKHAIIKWKYALLVEGQMDLLMAHQAGFNNAVATSGTALTVAQLQMLSRFSRNLLIAYDGDRAGVEAGRRAWSLALSLGMDVKMARIPEGVDPADLILKDVASFKETLRKSKHIIEFYLDVLLSRGLSGRELGKEIEHSILPYVKALESKIEQSHFISIISSRTGIKEEALLDSLSRTTSSFPKVEQKNDGVINATSFSTISKEIVGKKEQLSKLIAGAYLLLKNETKANEFYTESEAEKDQLLFTAEEWLARSKQSPEKYLEDLLRAHEREELRESLNKAMREFHEAESKGDQEKAKELLKHLDEIRKKISHYSQQ